jgi:heme/copper-type cytochrome/quinol oxidase subunit 2
MMLNIHTTAVYRYCLETLEKGRPRPKSAPEHNRTKMMMMMMMVVVVVVVVVVMMLMLKKYFPHRYLQSTVKAKSQCTPGRHTGGLAV